MTTLNRRRFLQGAAAAEMTGGYEFTGAPLNLRAAA